ncbi:siderophore-interacting protein [Tenggerimyces flavus]|uniref:Siderophore-interacting protein n=1 Tax=Tenggerimyces flavus TaxID=1708749 RepID=A0ABV7YA10_9ACTN|nr:siderophore-interacting protein [Tenggerimyces flavus]MBM7790995.1 NADPH-dependent ferric siderophore reductase [Tenggerimyces flavus]
MSNIVVSHAESGLVLASVVRASRISPHFVRVTLGGSDLARFEPLGFDQWMRLALPVSAGTRFDNLAPTFGMKGFLRYLTLPRGTRPVIRNYTVRSFRRSPLELDIDFVVHGTEGVAGPWAAAVQPGERVAFIDQGCGWRPVPASSYLLVCDESGLPAVAGVLRDLPRSAVGTAVVELFDLADRQEVSAPPGVAVRWLVRPPGSAPGSAALAALAELDVPTDPPYCFAVGEQALVTGTRRHLVARGVPKTHITFSGYWRRPR